MSATPHPLVTTRIVVVEDDDYVQEVTEIEELSVAVARVLAK